MKRRMFGWGMLAALLTFGLALAGCDNPTGGTDSSYKPTYELEGGGTLTITGGEGETTLKTGDTFELVIGGKTITGTIEVAANGTITFIPKNGGDPFTANPGSEGAITIDGGSIIADDGATVEVPSGEVTPSAPGGQTNAELLVGTWYDSNNTPATFTSDGKYLSPKDNDTYTATETTIIINTGKEVFSFNYTISQNGNTLTLTLWDDTLSQTTATRTVPGGGQTNAELLVGTWYDSNNTPATFTSDGKYLSPKDNDTYTATETTITINTGKEVFSFNYTISQNGNTLTLTLWDGTLSQTTATRTVPGGDDDLEVLFDDTLAGADKAKNPVSADALAADFSNGGFSTLSALRSAGYKVYVNGKEVTSGSTMIGPNDPLRIMGPK